MEDFGNRDAAPNNVSEKENALGAGELKVLLGIKNNHLKELYERLAEAELAADEAGAIRDSSGRRMEDLEEQRDRLRERVRQLEEAERRRNRHRDENEEVSARAAGDLERKDAEISRLENTLAEREAELGEALSRIDALARDLDSEKAEAARLGGEAERLGAELDEQREYQRRLADPANRLRAGIDLFNDSKHTGAVQTLSRDLGQPEVHAALEDGEEPAAALTFTWQGITWQTYIADPGPAVEEPRVYLTGAGEDLSGVDREPPNARMGPGGRVALGL